MIELPIGPNIATYVDPLFFPFILQKKPCLLYINDNDKIDNIQDCVNDIAHDVLNLIV